MQYILSILPLLACPVGMGLMIWFMMRGNKQQAPGEMDHARMQTYRQPRERPSETPVQNAPASAHSSPLKAIVDCMQMCLNWKVLAGLAVVGLIVLVVAPQFIGAALPLLLVAACPLSMLFMMRGMSRNGNATTQMQGEQVPAVGVTRDEHLATLKSRLSSVQAEQEDIARRIDEMESPEVAVISEAEVVARAADRRNRKRTPHRRTISER